MIKTEAQKVENLKINTDRIKVVGLEDWKNECILIAVNKVAQVQAKENMYEVDDLKGYLTEKAITIVQKFDVVKAGGWKHFGSFLYFTLSNHAKNFNKIHFNYLKGICPMEVVAENTDSGETFTAPAEILQEEYGFEDAEFEASRMYIHLVNNLSIRQKFILKKRLDGALNPEIAEMLGLTKVTVGRELKKIAELALDAGFEF